MTDVRKWLKTLLPLLADLLDAKVKTEEEKLAEDPKPGSVHFLCYILQPKVEGKVRHQDFMNRDLGKTLYTTIQTEAWHSGIPLRYVTIDYDPKRMEIRLSLSVDCQR